MLDDIFFIVESTAILALAIYEAADNVDYNKAQCKNLGRTCSMIHERLASLPKEYQVVDTFKAGIEAIHEALEEAKLLILGYQDKHISFKLLSNAADAQQFLDINERLSRGITHLGLSLDIQSILNQDRIIAAQAADRQYFIENKAQLQKIAQQQLQTHDQLLAVVSTAERNRQADQHLASSIQAEQAEAFTRQFDRRFDEMSAQLANIMHQGSPQKTSSQFEALDPLPLATSYRCIDFCDVLFKNLIAKGDHAQVFQAIWQGQIVAVRRMNHAEVSQYQMQLHNEMQTLHDITHPNIVHFYGGMISRNSACMVMEYMNGGNLRNYIDQKDKSDFTLYHQLKIAYDIVLGLQCLHTKNKTHNALTSHHVMLKSTDGKLHAKLIDFEKSTTQSKTLATVSTQNIDALRWCAPERVMGKKADKKQDIYSFGLIVWELVTGLLPFAHCKTEIELLRTIGRGELPEMPADLPVNIRLFIELCCASKPENRPDWPKIQAWLEKNMNPEFLYQEGSGFEKRQEYIKARMYYEASDAAGYAKAPAQLALMAIQGHGNFLPNAKIAFQFFKKGHERHHLRSTLNLAECLAKGMGEVEQDIPKAVELYQQLINARDLDPRMKEEAINRLDNITTRLQFQP